MPLAINQFIYIPPHEWEKHKRLAALLREAYPEMALPAKCAQCQGQTSRSTQSTDYTTSTRPTEETAPVAAPLASPAVAAPMKPRAAQGHKTTTKDTSTCTTTTTAKNTKNTNPNTVTAHQVGRNRWTSLGDGFWYSAGPTVAAPWRTWTWLDVGKQALRWTLGCCIVFAVLCAVRVKLELM